MIPDYLNDLHLAQVFADYTPSVDSYIQESASNEDIVDSKTHRICGFVSASFGQEEKKAGKFFSIENNTGRAFSLLQIDNGIIKKNRGPATKKCDCAIANETHLFFIEFKTDVYSENDSVLRRNHERAMEQLSSTIAIFDNYHTLQGVNIRMLRSVEAFICFRQSYPRKTSSQMNYQVSFAAANNGIPLSFDRKKIL